MATLSILKADQHADWMDVLSQCCQHDFHHLPEYHLFSQERGEGVARLFVCREREHVLALPLMLRPINAVPCHAEGGADWWDATCVYGYGGPVASHAEIPMSVLQEFRGLLHQELLKRRIVTVFSRLHPLIPTQCRWLSCSGECKPMGQTVSIDLTLPIEMQRAQYRKDFKRQINKLERLGAVCVHDEERRHLAEFVHIYRITMARVEASEEYFFRDDYFQEFVDHLGSRAHLFVCLLDGVVICGGLFTLCNGIVQAHLVGTRDDYADISPVKLLFEKVRLWANDRGVRVLHLGGGVGGSEDGVFHFKAGFSSQRHPFAIWFWVLMPEVNEQLIQEKNQAQAQCASDVLNRSYYPAYRCRNCAAQGLNGRQGLTGRLPSIPRSELKNTARA